MIAAARDVVVDRTLFSGPAVSIGTFSCAVDSPVFADTGPVKHCLIVFPRTSVWIRHEGSRSFLADPNVVTLYNRGQRYTRAAESGDGDRCDWFGVSDAVAHEIADSVDPAAGGKARPFRFEWAPSSSDLYLQQRRLSCLAARGHLDCLEAEEGVIELVASVLTEATTACRRSHPASPRAVARHRDLADLARRELARNVGENPSVGEIARRIGVSPYHLCRVFRACTGRSMHNYRTELRLRVALERLAGHPASHTTLSALALQVGFASHSHFVNAMRRMWGVTPTIVRARLNGE